MADSTSLPPALRSVCVYCGSSNDTLPAYLDLATRLGEAIAKRGIRLVYGGGSVGLMGRVAIGAHKGGAEVLGIMPNFLARREIVLQEVPHRMVETMAERKQIMFEESDGFIVLPGGIGTLEEAVEMLSWQRLGLHKKPVVFLSEDDFWAPFFHLIQHTIDANLTPKTFLNDCISANSIESCFEALDARVRA